MNLAYQKVNEVALALPTGPKERTKVIAAGVGLAVAATLPLPTTEVHDVEGYYNMQVSVLINAPLSDIGEAVSMDMPAALEFTRQFWMLRYASAFPGPQLTFAVQSPYGFFDTLAGVALNVGSNCHEFCNAQKEGIFAVAFTTLKILREQGQEMLKNAA